MWYMWLGMVRVYYVVTACIFGEKNKFPRSPFKQKRKYNNNNNNKLSEFNYSTS